jgi:cell division protein FtsW
MERERLLILLIVTLLIGMGLMMILNSGSYQRAAGNSEAEGDYFLKRQLVWVCISVVGLVIASNIRYQVLMHLSPLILLGCLGLLALVYVPGFGVEKNHARRWISLAGEELQPAEVAKYGLILYFSAALAGRQRRIERPSTFVELVAVLGAFLLLVIMQPDLSTTILIAGTVGIMFFCGRVPLRYLGGAALASVPALAFGILRSPYQLKRILAVLDPAKYRLDVGYQQYQALIALGSGGPCGVGLAESSQKLGFITYAHNDFIAAIIGEEFGFLGLCALLLLYVALVVAGFRIALRAPDLRGGLLAVGITSLIGLQALIHLGVVSSSLPATGLNLPFVSFGGSNLLMNFLGLGILLNVSRAVERVPRHQHGVRLQRHGLARA